MDWFGHSQRVKSRHRLMIDKSCSKHLEDVKTFLCIWASVCLCQMYRKYHVKPAEYSESCCSLITTVNCKFVVLQNNELVEHYCAAFIQFHLIQVYIKDF